MGVVRVHGLFLNFNPFSIFGMGEARNVKFGIRVDLGLASSISRMTEHPQMGRGQIQGLNF